MSDTRWASVPGTPYEVSDHGAVRAVDTGRVLTPHRNPDGYLRVVLLRPTRRVAFAHVLMLEAFVGPRPPGMLARHANDVPDDNRLDNLSWGTPIDNAADRDRNGRTARGPVHGKHKVTADLVAVIRSSPESSRVLGARLGLGHTTILSYRR